MLKLHIANKNYSSWSLRPWVLLKELNIPFEEKISLFNTGSNYDDFRNFSPNGMVPCLIDEEQIVWESLAISEYLFEIDANVWPKDKTARTWSRCASAEMHAGFSAIRNICPMSCGVRVKLNTIDEKLQKDLNRLDELWTQGLTNFSGPFLAGDKYTAVDAFFAPVVFRIQSFNLKLGTQSMNYVQHILSLNSMNEWYEEALKETVREIGHEKECTDVGTIIADYRAV